MTSVWINLSTRWDLSSVQAALNVIITLLGTVGIWSFSRFWWQKGCSCVLRQDSTVPLATLLTLAGPGEGWDTLMILRKKIFAKENWNLLIQVLVILSATSACMFGGPISKASLRGTRTVQRSQAGILHATKGDSYTANLIDADVLWNDTIASLNFAKFPTDQLLEYLPPPETPWVYVESEWDPTWRMSCNYTPETEIQNLTATGKHSLFTPLDAFPAYRATYDPSWLDESEFRAQANFATWFTTEPAIKFIDALFFIMVVSDPEKDDRMHKNNDTMRISISTLHGQNFTANDAEDLTLSGESILKPVGPVAKASYTRTECEIIRKSDVPDPDSIPWIWDKRYLLDHLRLPGTQLFSRRECFHETATC